MQTRIAFLGSTLLFCCVSLVANKAVAKTFHFRAPHTLDCRIEENPAAAHDAFPSRAKWQKVFVGNSTNTMELGDRIVVQLKPGADLNKLLAGRAAKKSRTVAPGVFILQATDAIAAMREAEDFAALPEVAASYPVMRRKADLQSAYASLPNDRYFAQDSSFFGQWNLENRDAATGSPLGADINVRGAWPLSLGEGVTIAVADTGVELNHIELTNHANNALHFNFANQSTSGIPTYRTPPWAHGTEVAGLIFAQMNNGQGVAGVASKAQLASWVIFDPNMFLASDEQMMDMYQYASNTVAVQNHSWGNSGRALAGPTLLEMIGISNAVIFGRSGRGVVMVRSAGNGRQDGCNSNDDGYPSDPRIIAVAGVRYDGGVTSYSEPGANILVGAPSGEIKSRLFTTDLVGTNGSTAVEFYAPFEELTDYAFDVPGQELGFGGTSAAAPQVSGIAGLIIAANTNLTYRDVQQILAFSARHYDFADPDLTTNSAGFRVSHNLGFGIPDAGYAVRLAKNWPIRPAKTNLNFVAANVTAIPDGALRLLISGENVPTNLASLAVAQSQGPHADSPTPQLPLVDVGSVTNTISLNLTNKAALIQHGTNSDYAFEITKAAQAGAAFAVLFNYSDTDVPSVMLGTDRVPIPAVLIGQTRGAALRNFLQTNATGAAQIHLSSANYSFNIPDTLICEHVGVRVSLNHPSRADLRITLLSPQGTRSVLQQANGDTSPAPTDWTFWSTHHFYESSAGTWTVAVSDEFPGGTGSVESIELIINGVAISDSDRDGLDDNWEQTNFSSLAATPKGDPDLDGNNNMREQILQTNPCASDIEFALDLSRLNSSLARLSWPSSEAFNYEILSGTNVAALNVIATVSGKFPETEYMTPFPATGAKFFQIRALPKP